jgi:RNA polymerase sigma factor (sigma-70 family)
LIRRCRRDTVTGAAEIRFRHQGGWNAIDDSGVFAGASALDPLQNHQSGTPCRSAQYAARRLPGKVAGAAGHGACHCFDRSPLQHDDKQFLQARVADDSRSLRPLMATRSPHSSFVESLYQDAGADLKSFVRRRLGDSGDVDDIVQESFLRISTRTDDRPLDNPRGFLFRTARNLIIDKARRGKVAAEHLVAAQAGLSGQQEQTEQISPERIVSAAQDLDMIMAAIEELPPACRRAFLLQRTSNLSYAEVARRLGISESMVQKHMSKALCHLYKVLP